MRVREVRFLFDNTQKGNRSEYFVSEIKKGELFLHLRID